MRQHNFHKNGRHNEAEKQINLIFIFSDPVFCSAPPMFLDIVFTYSDAIIESKLLNITADISCGMVRLTVHTEAALLYSSQLLQLLVQDVHCLLHTLPLRHRHLANTASQTKRRVMLENISVIDIY